MSAKGQLQNLLSNMKWPAGEPEEEDGEEGLLPQQQQQQQPRQALSLKTFPWLEFARLLGGWISGA